MYLQNLKRYITGYNCWNPGKILQFKIFVLKKYSKRCFQEILLLPEQRVEPVDDTVKDPALLVRVLRGSIFDAAVDIRKNSPTYGKSIGVEITADSHQMIWVPVGFAHGLIALEDNTEVHYKTTDFYYPEYDAGILWNDPALGIAWPLEKYGIAAGNLSEKDAKLPLFKDLNSPFIYER